MAEIATVARPWAQALYQASLSSAGQLEAATAWVEELGMIAADPDLIAFCAHPARTDQQVYDLMVGLLKSPLGRQGENFVRHLIAQQRVPAMPAIALQFRALKNARQGVVDAQVSSAFVLDDAQKKALQRVLEQRFGCNLVLHIAVAPELIGGVRVRVGDEVLDASVQARLKHLQATLLA